MIIRILASIGCMILCFHSVIDCIEYEQYQSTYFVNRWAFQNLCDFVFDPRKIWPTDTARATTFEPRDVKSGNMIFVRDAHQFFKKMHDAIEVPYFIMTHGEYLDKFIPTYFKYLNDSKILGWFTIHPCSAAHERVFALPLGVIQYKDLCLNYESTHKLFKRLREDNKPGLLYMNFTDWCNPGRKKIRHLFLDKPFCKSAGVTHFGPYISELSKYKFVISPPGLGPDCYRVWESLLVGTIPIVQRSHIDGLYDGFPVLFIDTWEEVTESFLQKKYKEITARRYSCEKLYMDYWIKFIQKTRKLCVDRYKRL
ncbi:hypothetical protein H0W26_00515 [Candidatus Dependentiae bacterium]|nr:hypothetical protein [Candidatus Dependentiae bacterium]